MTERKPTRAPAFVSLILAAIASFWGTFFLIERSLATVGVPLNEANEAGIVAGLSVAGLVIVAHKLRCSRRL